MNNAGIFGDDIQKMVTSSLLEVSQRLSKCTKTPVQVVNDISALFFGLEEGKLYTKFFSSMPHPRLFQNITIFCIKYELVNNSMQVTLFGEFVLQKHVIARKIVHNKDGVWYYCSMFSSKYGVLDTDGKLHCKSVAWEIQALRQVQRQCCDMRLSNAASIPIVQYKNEILTKGQQVFKPEHLNYELICSVQLHYKNKNLRVHLVPRHFCCYEISFDQVQQEMVPNYNITYHSGGHATVKSMLDIWSLTAVDPITDVPRLILQHLFNYKTLELRIIMSPLNCHTRQVEIYANYEYGFANLHMNGIYFELAMKEAKSAPSERMLFQSKLLHCKSLCNVTIVLQS